MAVIIIIIEIKASTNQINQSKFVSINLIDRPKT